MGAARSSHCSQHHTLQILIITLSSTYYQQWWPLFDELNSRGKEGLDLGFRGNFWSTSRLKCKEYEIVLQYLTRGQYSALYSGK